MSGTVLQTKKVRLEGTNTQNLVVMIKTTKNDKRLLIDPGPQKQLSTSIVCGSRMSVEGVVVRVGNHQLLIANRLRDDDKIVASGWVRATSAGSRLSAKTCPVTR